MNLSPLFHKSKKLAVPWIILPVLIVTLTAIDYPRQVEKNRNQNAPAASGVFNTDLVALVQKKPTEDSSKLPKFEGATSIRLPDTIRNQVINNISPFRNDRIFISVSPSVNSDIKENYIYNLKNQQLIKWSIQNADKQYYPSNVYSLTDGRYYFKTEEQSGVVFINSNLDFEKEVLSKYDEFEVSPDGKYIASYDDEGLIIMDSNFQNRKLLLKNPANQSDDVTEGKGYKAAGWTKDSSKILYTLYGWEWVEYSGIISLDGSENQACTDLQGSMLYPLNGNRYLYCAMFDGPCTKFGVLDADSMKASAYSPASYEDEQPDVSPAGKWIYYQNQDHFIIQDSTNGSTVKLIKALNMHINTAFIRNDQYILFSISNYDVHGMPATGFPANLYLMKVR